MINTATRLKLLRIFNFSLKKGKFPQMWKEALIIPIHKKGKDKTNSSRTDRLRLTSLIWKPWRGLLIFKTWDWENHIRRTSGFQTIQIKWGSCDLSITRNGRCFSRKESALCYVDWPTKGIWQGMEREGLTVKAQRCVIGEKMYRWVPWFLHNRKGRGSVDGKVSRTFQLRHGVSQGGVISPTLFLILIDNLVKELPNGINAALYSDELVVWCTEEYATTTT